MKKGFTTGSCSAAAAKAAAYMLLSGNKKQQITIETPAGIMFTADIVDIEFDETKASCAIVKDGGDDPDVTTGSHIVATVSLVADDNENKTRASVVIEGGKGVGVVTLPGLDQPVGVAAINHIPREMIEKEVLKVCDLFDFCGILRVVISVPNGEELAKKTFNPRLGIVDGISILGTTGIVEPMSTKAIIDTIRVELNQKRALGQESVLITPGNYGKKFLKEQFGYDLDDAVKCSNFIGETVDMVCEMGFKEIILAGHIGKLIKIAGGIMNTHSHEADCRMEILSSCALKAGADKELAIRILGCLNTQEAIEAIDDAGLLDNTMDIVLERILFYLNFRASDRIKINCIVYSNESGLLGSTIDKIKNNQSSESNRSSNKKQVHFVGAGCGAADLITVRGRNLLEKADVVIYAGSLINPDILKYTLNNCELYNSGTMTLEEVMDVMVLAVKQGKTVVRLHTGEPSIYGAIQEQMEMLDNYGINYDSCPGISACFGAASSLNLEYTLPGISQSLIITRIEGRTAVPEKESIESFASHGASMAIYLSTGLLEELSRRLIAGGYSPNTPAAIVYKATWPDEEKYVCTVDTLAQTAAEHSIKNLAVIIVSDVINKSGYERSRLYDPDFETGIREKRS